MRLPLAIFCIFLCGTSVQAQNGVSNVRDGNGNLIRNAGAAARGQGSGSNVNGPTMNVPARGTTDQSAVKQGHTQVIRAAYEQLRVNQLAEDLMWNGMTTSEPSADRCLPF